MLSSPPPPLENCKKKFAWLVAPNSDGSTDVNWKVAEGPFDPLQYQQQTEGYDTSLSHLKNVFSQQGSFDGILGFSQGAAMAALISAQQEQLKGEMDFKFVIICSGFSLNVKEMERGIIKCPSLHIFGNEHGKDRQIANQASKELTSLYDDGCSVIIEHDCGHIIPTRSPYIDEIKGFLGRFLSFPVGCGYQDQQSHFCVKRGTGTSRASRGKGEIKKKMEVSNKYIVIKHYFEDAPKESDFEIKTETLGLSVEEGSDDMIVKNLYISIDPFQINRMKSFSASQDAISYSTRITPGKAIDGPVIGKVVASGNNKFVKDDLVLGVFTWAEYCFVKERTIMRKLEPSEFPLTYHLGVLAKEKERVCIGKLRWKGRGKKGCDGERGERGCARSGEGCNGEGDGGAVYARKVAFLKDKLVFDDAFNYKEETDQSSTLRRYFPEGIDIYFDNVGGKMLEAVIDNMNTFGRVAVCGATSEYIDIRKRASLDLVNVIYKRIIIQGFLTPDLMIHHFQNFMIKTSNYLRTGELQVTEDISLGIESVPSAFVGLFNGNNIGKKIVRLVEEEE
ncbi:hypothetical protein AHAS_Ahas19G0133000 [Arachis hypogaea]